MHAGAHCLLGQIRGSKTHKTGHRRAPGRQLCGALTVLKSRTRAFHFKSLPRTSTPGRGGDPSPEEARGDPSRGRVGEDGKQDPGPGKGGPTREPVLPGSGAGPQPRGAAGRVDRSDPGPAAACPAARQPAHRDQQHRGAQQLPGQRRPLSRRQPRPQHRHNSPGCRRRCCRRGRSLEGPRAPGCLHHCLTAPRPGAAGARAGSASARQGA